MKKDSLKLTSIEIYNQLLNGEIKRFPNFFWQDSEGYKNATDITRYLINHILKWNDKEILANLNIDVFKEHKLHGMVCVLFNNSHYKAINNAFPNRFKPWEFKEVCNGYWTKDTAIEAVKWLIEEKLQWSTVDITNNLEQYIFQRYGLGGMTQLIFKGSTYLALMTTYPERAKYWDNMRKVRNTTKLCV